MVKARSRYKQVRFTFTEEACGDISWSMYIKPLNAEWNQHQCVARGRMTNHPPMHTLEDALSVLDGIIEQYLLPRSH